MHLSHIATLGLVIIWFGKGSISHARFSSIRSHDVNTDNTWTRASTPSTRRPYVIMAARGQRLRAHHLPPQCLLSCYCAGATTSFPVLSARDLLLFLLLSQSLALWCHKFRRGMSVPRNLGTRFLFQDHAILLRGHPAGPRPSLPSLSSAPTSGRLENARVILHHHGFVSFHPAAAGTMADQMLAMCLNPKP